MSVAESPDYEAQLAGLHREYREQLEARVAQLYLLAKKEDFIALADALHRLTGSAASFGCRELSDCSREGELALKQGVSIESLNTLLARLARLAEHESTAWRS